MYTYGHTGSTMRVMTATVEQIWLIHSGTVGQSPRVEYLSTLEKHQGTVNVVRWSPNGTSCLPCSTHPLTFRLRRITRVSRRRSANHSISYYWLWVFITLVDGMIVIWTPTDRQQPSFGRNPEEVKYDKEFWRAKTTIRCVSYYVYMIVR